MSHTGCVVFLLMTHDERVASVEAHVWTLSAIIIVVR